MATIKPGDPAATSGWSFPTDGHHISCVNASTATIVVVAYGVHPKQIVGAPEWFNKSPYDVSGIPDLIGVPDFTQIQEMYRKLLAERFRLSFHREVRNLPIYALTVLSGGPNLRIANSNENAK